MLRDIIKAYYKKFSSNKYILSFGKHMSAENLWHFKRESVARGIALGIACSWIPLPFHTLIAIFFAVLIDCNIPLVAVAIWFANPLTMPIMYYLAYRIGAAILNVHAVNIHFHLNIQDVLDTLHTIWQPFLLGCFIYGLVTGVLAYLIIHMLWPNINDKFDW